MTILLDRTTRVLVQGISGQMGRRQAAEMLRSGTKVVAGVSPGKGGQSLENVPVFNTVAAAVAETQPDLSVLFVSAMRVKDGIEEAIEAGIKTIICVAEFVPVRDAIEIKRRVNESNVRLIGPNCSGVISPRRAKVGFYCDDVCLPGDVGVISKSGTLSYAVLLEMKRRGIGASTVVGVGGDEVKGTTFRDCLEMFESDPDTRQTLIIGEIGGRDEEDAAAFIAKHAKKPAVAFVSGRTIPPGRNIGHAGAMIVGEKGTYDAKVKVLTASGVQVAHTIEDIPDLLKRTANANR